MKLSKKQQAALTAITTTLETLSSKEVAQVEFYEEVKNLLIKKSIDWARSQERKQLQAAKDAVAATKKKQQQKRDKQVAGWVPGNVFAGDIVKMSGTRDGHGIRKVVNIKSHNTWFEVECVAFRKIKRISNQTDAATSGDIPALCVEAQTPSGKVITVYFEQIPQMTTHGCEKVIAVLRNGEMVRVEQLIKG